ncbi:MAG: calcium/proton exchanger [Acidobacteriota bacterium]|nr:calcium/proton exchanger [Blastocatellia bacterium]MDW8238689.1 calcium/proton exchanger [Acidobacteriota bacterium]
MKIGRYEIEPLMLLLIFVPISIVLELTHADPAMIFVSCCIAIIPLAGLMGKATEHLAERMGAGLGGLLNATFGNAAELIIALMALRAGLYDVVKASITGSIIGNILLVLGLALLVGGLKYPVQRFNRTAAGLGATLLTLSVIGLVVPAIFHAIVGSGQVARELNLSLEIAIVLFITYLLSLVFALRTHRHLYAGQKGHAHDEALGIVGWSKTKAVTVLLVATALVALMSELLVGAVEHTAETFGMSDVFIGVIVVAIVGNAAEHSTAILVAAKNQMDLAMNIAVGSSIQIALFVAPVLVFVSYLLGRPMDLLFTVFEVVSVALAVGTVSLISLDGESNWMEGVQLLAVYLILGIAFYFLP